MSNKKQTAVGFLESTLIKRLEDAGIFISKFDYKLIEIAKAMEKEQIMKGIIENYTEDMSITNAIVKAKQYIKHTYEK